MLEKIKKAQAFIEKKTVAKPLLGLILGSGLGSVVEEIENQTGIDFLSIPNFSKSSVKGHAGKLIFGAIEKNPLVAMQGRIHFYEGNTMEQVTFPLRVLISLGIKYLIVTNAAGGINEKFSRGDLMLISDHINLMGANPLHGKNFDKLGPRFVDMTEAYNKNLIKIAKKAAADLKIKVQQGVYVGLSGPTYETPAEVRMLKILGGDVVGMSTVPEVIVANQQGIKVLGLSMISNLAAGISKTKLDHQEVLETSKKVGPSLNKLLKEIIVRILKNG